ncbi:hypothetical protein ACOMHN_045665 [Nucella lapillus]
MYLPKERYLPKEKWYLPKERYLPKEERNLPKEEKGLGGVNLLYGLAGGRVSLRGVDLLSCCAVVDVRVDDPLAVSAAL